MEKHDRDGISALYNHNQHRMMDMRDASAQIPSSQAVWKKPATPINTPATWRKNQQPMTSYSVSRRVASPYDNMTSRGHRTGRSEVYGNKTARKVLLYDKFAQGSSNSSRRGVKSAEVIEIVDNEEDIGVLVRSDPMNMVDDPPYIPPSKKPKLAVESDSIHLFSDSHQDEPHPSTGKYLPMDGADTIALERQINNQDSDAIEYFTDESSPIKVGTQKGNVLEKVTKIEQISVPRIDLRKIQQPKSVKGGMKPKNGNQNTSSSFKASTVSPHFPPTSSLLRNASSNNTSSSKRGFSKIRIKEFFLGTEHKKSEHGYHLYWDPDNKNTVTIKEGNMKGFQIMFDVLNEITGVKSTQPPPKAGLTVIELSTSRSYMRGMKRESETFKMGDRWASGKITLKLDTDHADWSDDNYTNLLNWIACRTDQSETIVGRAAAQSVWETATRSAELQQAGSLRKRKNATEESHQDPRPAKRSAPDSVETLALDESTPPPIDQPSINLSKPRSSDPIPSRATIIPQPPRTRISPPAPSGVLRRSSRQAATMIERPPSVDLDEVILCYPQGVPGAVNITNADFRRLQPGEFLNDTLIEFGLKLWLRNMESTNPELAKQIYVFSSFFYKKLNVRNIEEGYNSVRKWTSKFDLFSKKYIIVPINENLHWYLAIIYNPAHILNPPLIVETRSPTTRRREQKPNASLASPTKPMSSRASSTSTSPPTPEVTNDNDIFSDGVVEKSLLNFDASCSITVTTEHSPSEAGTVNIPEDIPPSPLNKMDIDDENLQGRNRSPTVSDHYPGGVPPFGSEMQDTDSSSTGAAEIEELFANDMDVEYASGPSTVNPIDFYGKLSKAAQGKQRETEEEALFRVQSPREEGEEEEEKPSSSLNSVPTTYIFTLDSLGSRHPQAIKKLSKYLKLEAKDKRNLSETSDACGKMAYVPVQPNFCDCGLYLVHFAQTFVTDPERYCHIINTRTKNPAMSDRQEDWEESKIADMRENMANDIRRLSVEWKQAKEQAKKKEVDGNAFEVIESTDDEIDIVETISAPGGKEKGRSRGGAAPKRAPAKRPR